MATKELAEILVKRYEGLKERRVPWESHFRDVRDYMRPRKRNVDGLQSETRGSARTNNLFDSTAIDANRILALSMQNSLCPSSVMWFQFKIPDGHEMAPLNDDPEVRAWFQEVGNRLFYQFHNSNFYSVIGEAFADYTSFGTICIYSEEDDVTRPGWNGMVFKAVPIGSHVFAEDKRGVVDTVFWEHRLSARQAAQQFGKNKLPDTVKESLMEKPDTEYAFIRVVTPRDDRDPGKMSNLDMPFASYDIFVPEKIIVREGGYSDFPFQVGRFSKEAGELWGRSPADVAMPDVRTINRMKQMLLQREALNINPPAIAPNQGFIGRFKMTPGAVNYSREPERFKFMEMGGAGFNEAIATIQDLKQSIRAIFMSDVLVMPEKSRMTAEEVITLRNQVDRQLAPTVSRFESEVLQPLVLRAFRLGWKAELYSPPPEQLEGLDSIEVDFIGQLAKSQKLQDVTAVTQWMSMLTNMVQFDPTVMDAVSLDNMTRITGERLGVPGTVFRSENEIMALRQQRQQQQAQQAQDQQMAALAEGVGKAGPGVKAMQQAAQMEMELNEQ